MSDTLMPTEIITPDTPCPECFCTFNVHLKSCSHFQQCPECRAMLHLGTPHYAGCSAVVG
jgi:hypothetical protein